MLDETTIRDLYTIKGWSVQKIADEYGLNNETVRKRMKKYDIPRRVAGGKKGPKSPEHTAKLKELAAKLNKGKFGADHPHWKGGGPWYDKDGYAIVRRDGKNVREHRYVLEQQLGRKLASTEHAHHLDETRTQNNPENLEALDGGEHGRLHWQTGKREKVAAYWTPERRLEKSKEQKKEVTGLNETTLRGLYLDARMTTEEIGKMFNLSRETIRQRLNEYGISVRAQGWRHND